MVATLIMATTLSPPCYMLGEVEYNTVYVLTPKLLFYHVPVSDNCINTPDLFDLLQLLDLSAPAFRWGDTYNTFKIMYVMCLNLIFENFELSDNVHVVTYLICQQTKLNFDIDDKVARANNHTSLTHQCLKYTL